ncbi:MAG: CDF family Co(II)/Ni(II) efflux transporter DmeF, partial [Betaproteobacteria bacterium]
MQSEAPLDRWRQDRTPPPAGHRTSERRAKVVLALTIVTMVAELIVGWMTGSMALTADGWHMGSHAAALGIAAFAYAFARRHATSERFSFGTGKVSALAGFSSALLLAVVAVLMAFESVARLAAPVLVQFDEAIVVAVLGLIVNIASALLLSGGSADAGHGHDHGHGHGHDHGHDHSRSQGNDAAPAHQDQNLRAAYLHVVADALTSILAIAALMAGKWLGWVWLDPTVGIAASVLIGWWAWGLLLGTGRVLLDAEENSALKSEIVRRIESDADNRV